jgi:hypothetical protein
MSKRKPKIKVVEAKLGREGPYGLYGKVDVEKPNTAVIDPRQRPKTELNTILHETLHIIWPDETETCIKNTAIKLRDVLWEVGYRKVKQ